MASFEASKRGSLDSVVSSQELTESSMFDMEPAPIDTPESPLSEYSGNISESSEAMDEKIFRLESQPLTLADFAASAYHSSPTPCIAPPNDFSLSALTPQQSRSPVLTPEDSRVYTISPQQSEIPFLAPEQSPTPIQVDPLQSQQSSLTSLKALAEQLLLPSRTPDGQKPEPSGQPEVWADGRQELCETLHYFRSWQGGGYTHDGLAWGFMFDDNSHPRDYMDSNVVISRSGGKMGKNKKTGQMALTEDQSETSPQTLSVKKSMIYFNPVVIIAGAENPTIPSKPPHTYCVLDYFKPTHVWSEKTDGKAMVRYRFEKLNTNKTSWWAPKDQTELVQLGELPPPNVQRCDACHEESSQVYLQGWMCLRQSCPSFWTLDDDSEPIQAQLTYDPRFLKQKTCWPNDNQVLPLTSNIVELSGHGVAGEDCARAFWNGMVCSECGRCVLRLSWLGWECPCGFERSPPHSFIPAKAIRDPYFPLSHEYTLSRDRHMPHVGVQVSFEHNYRINKYVIPGIDGFVVHLIANKPIVEESRGPDEMFEELQKVDIGLRRRAMPGGQCKGDMYTRHFNVNYGMPYKFIAATASNSLEDAAPAIRNTRSRLNWASEYIVKDRHLEFNEVLALGYFEQQKISYHDDGESGLGPTIATLSLGAPGTMRLRMKARHYNGTSKEGIYNDALPIPGCKKYAERLATVSRLAQLKAGGKGESYREHLRTTSKKLGLTSSGQAKDAITLAINHGDIVIMHGADIQKYYEHSVDHAGKLRFALTCRYIDPLSLKEADRPAYDVKPDEGFYDGSEVAVVERPQIATSSPQIIQIVEDTLQARSITEPSNETLEPLLPIDVPVADIGSNSQPQIRTEFANAQPNDEQMRGLAELQNDRIAQGESPSSITSIRERAAERRAKSDPANTLPNTLSNSKKRKAKLDSLCNDRPSTNKTHSMSTNEASADDDMDFVPSRKPSSKKRRTSQKDTNNGTAKDDDAELSSTKPKEKLLVKLSISPNLLMVAEMATQMSPRRSTRVRRCTRKISGFS
jgi:hypothetical protein